MSISERIRPALRAGFKHLLVSLLVASAAAALVFGIWYPSPYGEIAGGQGIFFLLVAVDVICGPLLTMVIYNPLKPRAELMRDIGLVVLIQLGALGYGLNSVMQARPVWLAFEGSRYRVVSLPDIDHSNMAQASPEFRDLGLTGPRLIGVRLADPTDPEFPRSIELSMQGLHTAFRPGRWVAYESQRQQVINGAKGLSRLLERHPDKRALVDAAVQRSGLPLRSLGYWPLDARHRTDWVVMVNLNDGQPVDYLPVDGWED